MKNLARKVAHFLNTRPLRFLSVVFGLRDIVVGVALALPRDWDRTVIYANLQTLGGARFYGILLATVAFLVVVTASTDNTKITQWGLRFQSWFWLFACVSYALTGFWLFAITNLLMCSITSGYIAFCYKHASDRHADFFVWRGVKV